MNFNSGHLFYWVQSTAESSPDWPSSFRSKSRKSPPPGTQSLPPMFTKTFFNSAILEISYLTNWILSSQATKLFKSGVNIGKRNGKRAKTDRWAGCSNSSFQPLPIRFLNAPAGTPRKTMVCQRIVFNFLFQSFSTKNYEQHKTNTICTELTMNFNAFQLHFESFEKWERVQSFFSPHGTVILPFGIRENYEELLLPDNKMILWQLFK